MKKITLYIVAALLGIALEMSVAASHFPVQASASPTTQIAEVAQELHPDSFQQHQDNSQFSPEAVQQRIQTYHEWQNQSSVSGQSPVDAVRSSAASLGLNAKTDAFYLTGTTASVATVHVIHQQKGYNVTLIPSGNGGWIAASISPAQ